MKAKSIKGKSAEEIKTAFEQSLEDGFKPTLAIVFLSIVQDRKAICSIFDKEGISIFGATTGGEFIDGEIGKESIAIMLLDINKSHFEIIFKETGGGTTREIASSIGLSGKKIFSNPAFIVASGGRFTDGTMIIKGIEDSVGSNAVIFGGLAGDDDTGTGTYVFDNKHDTDNGLIALIIEQDKISVTGFATSGWQPIGIFRTITKSEGTVVYTIDDEPALDIMKKFLGLTFDTSSEEVTYLPNVASPIQLFRDNAPSVLREIRAINVNTHSIIFVGTVPQGSKFRFSLPPDWNIIDTIQSDCKKIKELQPEADALILFSCASRLTSLGPMVSTEIDDIKKTWDCPLTGYFSYGEIGNYHGGKTEFHNNTCSIVLLKEK